MKFTSAVLTLFWIVAGVFVALPAFAETKTLQVTVSAGQFDRENVPVKVIVTLPEALKAAKAVTLADAEGNKLAGQVTGLGLLASGAKAADGQVARELHFVVPKLKAGQTLALSATIGDEASSTQKSFAWTDMAGKYSELNLAGRPVLRYMYEAIDTSTNERRMETYKPYHHVYDPQGNRFVTKGPGGLFPHHRGLYYGFNRISYDEGKKQADTWHCNKGEWQSHEGVLAEDVGPVLGRHVVAIDWHGQDGNVFAKEQREMSAYNVPGGLLIEFASRLTTTGGTVKLDGDPQHAGFQFRASQDVPDHTAKLTYYLRPDGKDKPGSFRNWPANKEHANLPWNALSFVLGEQRYTCCYLDRPENPKESRYSERDYGRFGSYFQYDLTEKGPLDLNYRVWLQEGEMTVEDVTDASNDFVSPPVATLKG
jgi:hypothetical protein